MKSNSGGMLSVGARRLLDSKVPHEQTQARQASEPTADRRPPGPLARSSVAAGFLSVVVVVEKPGFPSRPSCRRRHARMPSHPAIFAHLAHHLFHPSSRPLPTQGSPPDESTTLDDHPGTLLHSQLPDRDGPCPPAALARLALSLAPVQLRGTGQDGLALRCSHARRV